MSNRAIFHFMASLNDFIVTKFRTKFTLLDIKPPKHLCRVRTEENIAAVSASVNDNHQLSIRRCSQKGFRCVFCGPMLKLMSIQGVIQKIEDFIKKTKKNCFLLQTFYWSPSKSSLEKLCSATKLIFGAMAT